MKLFRVMAVCAALLAPAAGASAQETTAATGRQPKADVGFGLEFQIAQTPGGMQRTGYPRVSSVRPGSSAQRVGLAVGDLLLSVDGRDTQRTSRWFTDAVPGRRYTLRVRSGGTEREIVVEAGPPPARN